ncbi:MAG: hypothetical protein AAFR61_09555 [Bacteroidota bacterium]
MSILHILFSAAVVLGPMACQDRGNINPLGEIDPGNDPHFTIVANEDRILKKYNRKVVVFGIDIYAVPDVEDAKLLHAANVMAQYLDNDEDGTVDDQLVLDKMLENKAYLVMWSKERDLRNSFVNGREGQDLGNDETNPAYVSGGKLGRFDASLEEVLHIINHAGHSKAYPQAFGQNQGSLLAEAMDIARGGQFMSIPDPYPAEAWYTYDDATCDYASCQTIEYLYWALTSMLGAQENRLAEIQQEWKLNTLDKVRDQDTAIYQLLSDPQFKMPTVLPDGSYRQ